MINLLRVTDLYRQHSIVQATFSFDLKNPAFKRLLEAKKLIQLWIRLGNKAESFPYVSTPLGIAKVSVKQKINA